MNFDSIEGLTEREIMSLFDDNVEKTAVSVTTWFGTYCKTYYNFNSSRCINSFSSTWRYCPIDCDQTIRFTSMALQEKCNNYCGGTSSFDSIAYHWITYYRPNPTPSWHDCNGSVFQDGSVYYSWGTNEGFMFLPIARCYR